MRTTTRTKVTTSCKVTVGWDGEHFEVGDYTVTKVRQMAAVLSEYGCPCPDECAIETAWSLTERGGDQPDFTHN